MLIFGSTALKYWLQDLPREPKDLDYIGEGQNKPGIEFHFNPGFQYIIDNNIDNKYVDLNYLYTIKVSHAAWDVRWDKTMHDIIFMKERGCKLDLDLYNLLIKDWINLHGPKNIKVEGTPEEFFKSTINRTVPHDELHHFVKFDSIPKFELIRPNKDSVKVIKQLWDNLSYDDKFKCAAEEAYVFALERYSQYPPKTALVKGLKNLITKSTKGYFNLFLIENFKELVYNNEHYINKYKQYRSIYD